MAQSRIRFPWHQETKGWRYTIGGGAISVAILVWWFAGSRDVEELWALRIGFSLFALVCFGFLVEQVTEVDAQSRKVIREGRLFGILPVYLSRRDVNEFTAVAVKSYRDSDNNEYVYLELLRPRGFLRMPFVVRYVQSRSEGVAVGRALASATGLPLQDQLK